MRSWSALKPNDLVDIVAPGFRCTNDDLQNALNFLSRWNLRARVPKGLFGRDILCSNSDAKRFSILKRALEAKDSKAVWCLRGGYGSIRLVPDLGKIKVPSTPKLFIGLSDISTLHVFLNQSCGWPTIHGPMVDRLGKNQFEKKWLKELHDLVFGFKKEITFEKLKPLNKQAQNSRTVRGTISGGNLITLQSSLGTKQEWRPGKQIIFFEDIGERGYRIDRVLEQFIQVGIFQSAKAVVLGQFTGGHEPDGTNKTDAVLKSFAQKLQIPVFSGVESGHGAIQRPVPFGTNSVLHCGLRGKLVCETGCK